jgi:hypothetical protein
MLGDSITDRAAREAQADPSADDLPPRGLQRTKKLLPLPGFDPRVERRARGRRGGEIKVGGRLDRQGEHPRQDARRLGQQRHALHHVRELADVAGPEIRAEGVPCGRREDLPRQSIILASALEEMLGQDRDVVGALSEWRQAQGQDGQTVVEILTEPASTDGRQEIFVRRGDNAHVDGLAVCASEAAD